jgi:hypothetical protein
VRMKTTQLGSALTEPPPQVAQGLHEPEQASSRPSLASKRCRYDHGLGYPRSSRGSFASPPASTEAAHPASFPRNEAPSSGGRWRLCRAAPVVGDPPRKNQRPRCCCCLANQRAAVGHSGDERCGAATTRIGALARTPRCPVESSKPRTARLAEGRAWCGLRSASVRRALWPVRVTSRRTSKRRKQDVPLEK